MGLVSMEMIHLAKITTDVNICSPEKQKQTLFTHRIACTLFLLPIITTPRRKRVLQSCLQSGNLFSSMLELEEEY